MLTNIIIAEDDSGIAVFFCGVCHRRFRAFLDRVTTADKTAICLACIHSANPLRKTKGLPEIPAIPSAYLD